MEFERSHRTPRLRILTLTNWYPPHHYGGYELSCFDVMRRLAQRGHEVEILCSDERRHNTVEPADPDHEHHVRRELRMYLRYGELLSTTLRERLAIERHNQRALNQALDDLRPDVVSVWHMGGLSIGLVTSLVRRSTPLVYAICDDWLTYYFKLDQWAAMFHGWPTKRMLGYFAERIVRVPSVVPALNRSGAFCFVSDFTRGKARARSPWPEFPISTVVYSGIERSLFSRRAAADLGPWQWRLVYVGRLDERKGLRTLIRCMRELPDVASLAIYGPGGVAERARWEALAEELSVQERISFGELAREDVASVLVGADVLVFPSEWEEPFGLTPLEAMACGTPVVATREGGSAEFLIDDENCIAFEAGNPSALAAAVRRLAADYDLRRKLAAGGLRTADQLSIDRLADVFEQWHIAAARRFVEGRPPDRGALFPSRPR